MLEVLTLLEDQPISEEQELLEDPQLLERQLQVDILVELVSLDQLTLGHQDMDCKEQQHIQLKLPQPHIFHQECLFRALM